MAKAKRILLLEDDAILNDLIYEYLKAFYQVDRAYDYDEALTLIEEHAYDLFIFDINLPTKDGITLLKELRSFYDHTLTLFITAYEDIEHLKLAFGAGASDYLKKPFDLEELAIRIKKVFGETQESKEALSIGENSYYYPATGVVVRGDKRVQLSAKEAQLLSYFVAHKGRAISHEELLYNLWDYNALVSGATLRSHIRRLREAIGKEKIATVRGIGYIYEV